MLVRTWHGWTSREDADAYERLLTERIAPDILAGGITGLRQLDVLRREDGDEVEFVTIMSFDDWDAVRAFAGDDPTASVVPTEARSLLVRHDEHSQHHERIARFGSGG